MIMGKLMNGLGAIDRLVQAVLKWLCILLFVGLTLILSGNIFIRYVPVMSFHWFDEVVELLYAGLVFYGAAAVWINKGHFSVGDWIGKRISNERSRHLYRVLLDVICLAFMLLLLKYSLRLVANAEELTPVFGISKKVHYSCMPISAALMAVYSVKHIIAELIMTAAKKPAA
jgi:TRAP-type C4-dicarboxylate transport system permease small subunit